MIDWWLLACAFAAFLAVRSLVQLAVQHYRVKYHFVLAAKQAELETQLEVLRKQKAEQAAQQALAEQQAKAQDTAKTPVKQTPPKKAA